MTLQQLACFCATAREGSFSGAARALRLSQPSVSDQVRRLEAELGARLVASGGRGISLTADGRAFLLHAERVLAGAEAAAASVGGGAARAAAATVSLGLTRNAPYYPFDELIARVLAQHPELRVRLPGQNSAFVAGAVRDGDLEAGVVILPVDPEGLVVRPLFRDEVVYVTADAARARRPVRIEDLAAARLILYDTSAGFGDPTRRQLAARAQAAGMPLRAQFDVEHPETALQFAARGLGDTIAAGALARSPGFPAALHTVPFAEPLYDDFALITRAGVLSGALQALLLRMEEWVEELPAQYGLHRL